jgi:YVTN family beta-propeller protein
VTSIPVPLCCPISEVAAAGGLVAVSSDSQYGQLLRIDPRTNHIVAHADLTESPPGGDAFAVVDVAVADGSVWVAMSFENRVYRIDPTTLAIQARIPTGRSPNNIVYGGGRLWIPQANDRSVAVINPHSNRIVRTVRVGKQSDSNDGPREVAWGDGELLASLPGSGRVAHVSGSTYRVTYDAVGADAASCAAIIPVPGGYWLDDSDCGRSYYRWDTSAHAITTRFTVTHVTAGGVYHQGALYLGGASCGPDGCTQGLIDKYDATSGAHLGRQVVGTEAFLPAAAFGSFWTIDLDNSVLQRSATF